MKKYFLSFADSYLKPSAERILQQAKNMNIYDEIFILNESNLDKNFRDKFKSKLIHRSRGFGHYCWKPQVILQILNLMDYGDILHWADVGCHLNTNGIERLKEYFDLTNNSPTGILAFEADIKKDTKHHDGRKLYNHIENEWTKGDLLDYFNVRDRLDIINTPQRVTTTLFLKKTNETLNFVKQWLGVIEHNFSLIDDTPSISPNLPEFTEHRHDQSIFSILCKLHNVDTVSFFEIEYPLVDRIGHDWAALHFFPVHGSRHKEWITDS